MAVFVDNRFPLSFYYRIADKIVREADVYREEGDSEGLCQALNRYSRQALKTCFNDVFFNWIISEIIPHHPGYSVHSNEMLQHKKILQEVAKELENLNSQIAGKNVRISRCSTGYYRQSESDSHNSNNGHKSVVSYTKSYLGITWRFPMNPIGLQKKLDDLVNLVGSLTKTTKEKYVDSPHFRTSSPHHTPVTHFSASFVETNRGHHYSRDHLSFSNLRVAAPPCRSLPSLDGRTSLGSSVGSVHYDSPLRPTHNHPSQPLASPDLDPASVNLIENRIRKEMSPEPETECIHFVDANDITDDKGFFEDET
ncbi:hypothetical protein M5K25_025321 [Dendrobium thyrsiflorum]|uniref:Uncharacterized protein n=1 Tax=Dendrobium thyrsiflorum TaxID=117978 RepID=A0ABD0U3U0_DENTH